jgi:hypothetical protein
VTAGLKRKAAHFAAACEQLQWLRATFSLGCGESQARLATKWAPTACIPASLMCLKDGFILLLCGCGCLYLLNCVHRSAHVCNVDVVGTPSRLAA